MSEDTENKTETAHERKVREEEELKVLRGKNINDLSYEEMEILRRLLFRKNVGFNAYKDSVGEIFSTLNFKAKNPCYTDDFEFTDEKQYETLHPDDLYHKRKNFFKTFEEEKCKHKIIIRK